MVHDNFFRVDGIPLFYIFIKETCSIPIIRFVPSLCCSVDNSYFSFPFDFSTVMLKTKEMFVNWSFVFVYIIRQKMKLSKQIILKKRRLRICELAKFGQLFLLETYSQCVFFMPYSTATLKQPSPKKTAMITPSIRKVYKVIS